MIYFFYGDSEYELRRELRGWKNKFLAKYDESQITHIKNSSEIDDTIIIDSIFSGSLFAEKRLFIYEIDSSFDSREKLISYLKNNTQKKQEENNIVVFSYFSPDKRGKFYKLLNDISTKSLELEAPKGVELNKYIQNKYGDKISKGAISRIIDYKGGDIQKIESEVERLLVASEYIDESVVNSTTNKEVEESVFALISDIMDLSPSSIDKLKNIATSSTSNSYYYFILSNLRINYYIIYFKNIGVNSSEIKEKLNLGKRGFLVDKNYKISFEKLKNLYLNLIGIDERQKKGQLIGTDEKDFYFEVERVFLSSLWGD